MNIVLTGMRGSGKSRIGKELAEHLKRKWVDIDVLIEKKAKQKIAQIVKEQGWDGFRKLEKKVALELSKKNNLVISAGGGTVCSSDNSYHLKKNGHIILLEASIKTLSERIENDSNRPPLTDEDPIRELQKTWEERKTIYRRTADLIVKTDNQSVEHLVQTILDHLRNISL